jgi:hypothetical protein
MLRAQAAPFDRDQRLGDRAAERVARAEQDDPVGRIFAHRDLDSAGEIVGLEDLGDEGVAAQARAIARERAPDMAAAVDHRNAGGPNQSAGRLARRGRTSPASAGCGRGRD